jgi:hypothetical protein
VSAGQESADSNIAGATTPSAAAAAPTISDLQLTTNAGLQTVADTGDVHRFIFSEPMDTGVDAAGSTYRVQDADGTIADIVCGTNATCALNAAPVTIGGTTYPINQVLTVTLTAAPTPETGFEGSQPGLQYALTVTDVSAEWVDAADGLQLDLAASADKVVDDEP